MALKDIWKDKIDGIDDVLAEDINSIAQAVIQSEEKIAKQETAINGKVDKVHKTSGIHVYTSENDGQRTRQAVNNPNPYMIALYDGNRILKTETPKVDLDCTNKLYVDNKCRDLQQGVYNALGVQYITVEDTSTSDFSQIPEGAMPFAYFESLGDIVVYGHDGKVIASTAEVMDILIIGEGGKPANLNPNSVPAFFEIPNGYTTIMLSLSIPEASEMSHFEIKGKKIIYQVKVGG